MSKKSVVQSRILNDEIVANFLTVVGVTQDDVLSSTFYPAVGDKDERFLFILKGFINKNETICLSLYSSGNLIVAINKEETDLDSGEVKWGTVRLVRDFDEVKSLIKQRSNSSKIDVGSLIGLTAVAA